MILLSVLDMDINDMFIQSIYNVEEAGIKEFHIDVMDGKFVKNNNLDNMYEKFKIIDNISILKKEVHLMTYNLKERIDEYALNNVSIITIHKDAIENNSLDEIIKYIKSYNIQAGIAIKPNENIEDIFPYLKNIAKVTIMSVEPGKGGQTFIEETYKKISKLKEEIKKQGLYTLIQVDGGINDSNIQKIYKSGADSVVIGSYLAKDAKDINKIISKVENLKKLESISNN